MNLPIIQTPTYELKLISIEEPVEYRPFLVKEEKILLTAMEDNDPNEIIRAVKQILINCTITEVDVENLPTFDMEYLFLNIRSKSIGETSDIIINCEVCEESIPLTIELDDIQPTMDESHTPRITLNDDLTIEGTLTAKGETSLRNNVTIQADNKFFYVKNDHMFAIPGMTEFMEEFISEKAMT